jgi:hypothetical protein
MPERSPFTSAAKTGTPAAENCSAMIWSVTVLPVPVAPAITPWRLARSSRRVSGLSERPRNRSELGAMHDLPEAKAAF